jgi:hypothetical protein
VISRRIALAASALAVAGLTGCGPGPNLVPKTTTGSHGRATIINVDAGAQEQLLGTIKAYVAAKNTRIVSASGTPDAVATAVKHGAVIDVVILPEGPALRRVSDELVLPPERLGTLDGTVYYVGTVTSRGLLWTKFLRTAQGRAILANQGFAP